MRPAEHVFRSHLEAGPFASGEERGRWRLLSIAWPFAVIVVSAAERPNSPKEYALRFELSNYPQSPPTACPWDHEAQVRLAPERRPHGTLRVPMAFRSDWKDGQHLYLPVDRGAIEGHEGWRNKHPEMIWSPRQCICQYLRLVHELLNSEDYTGVRNA